MRTISQSHRDNGLFYHLHFIVVIPIFKNKKRSIMLMKERRVEDFLSDSQVHACVGSRYGNFCILEEIIFFFNKFMFHYLKMNNIGKKIFPYIAKRIKNELSI